MYKSVSVTDSQKQNKYSINQSSAKSQSLCVILLDSAVVVTPNKGKQVAFVLYTPFVSRQGV